MISPTAPSKSLASLFMSTLRCSAARFSVASSPAFSRTTSRPLVLNTSTVRAISPTSSRRSMPGTVALKSLRAKASITDLSSPIGRARPLVAIHNATARLNARPRPAASMTERIALSASSAMRTAFFSASTRRASVTFVWSTIALSMKGTHSIFSRVVALTTESAESVFEASTITGSQTAKAFAKLAIGCSIRPAFSGRFFRTCVIVVS